MTTPTPLTVTLVAVEAQVWSGDAASVYVRTTEGEMGILPGHIPMLGEIAVDSHIHINTPDKQRLDFDIEGGFVSVTSDGVTILAETASQVETMAA